MMSKFRNRIRDVGRASGGIGFAAIAQRERPRYFLVVAAVSSADDAEAAVRDGADALVAGGLEALREIVTRVQVPVGARIEAATSADVTAAQDAGADFFVFDDARTQAAALVRREIGRVLLLGPDWHEERLRSVAAIDLDALLVEAEPGSVTVRDQIELRRVTTLTGAPLLIHSAGAPDAATLEAWRDAGAPAVLVASAQVRAALAAAAEVPPPTRRSRGDAVPTLGAPVVAANDHDDDDEE